MLTDRLLVGLESDQAPGHRDWQARTVTVAPPAPQAPLTVTVGLVLEDSELMPESP